MEKDKPLEVLLVEDNEDHAHFIEKSLNKERFNITTLTDGKQAFDYLINSDEKPDVTLLDYHLPLMDGLEVLKKTKESGKDFAFIFLTVDTSIDVAVEAMKAGALDFLPKTRRFYTGLPPMIEKVYRIHKDKLEKKIIAEELRESEEKYRNLFENSPFGIGITDKDGNMIAFNDAMLQPGGYSWEDMVKIKNISELYYNPDEQNKILATAIELGYINEAEVQFKRKDGTPYDTLLSLRPIQIKGESCWQTMVQDVTKRKQAEEERKKLEVQLQRAQKMEAIGTLAGGVAHDLNNILAGLVSYPEFLSMEIPEESPLRRPILIIKKSGEKAAAIVQDLLTLARRGVAATEVVNLNHIIPEYVKSPEHEKLKSFHPNVQFKTELETDLLNILGSPTHLSKTVMNLVINAAEAMPYGGKISISTENRYLDRSIRGYDHIEEGDYVILTVSDTGVGISPEDMERIFEPFYTKKVMRRSGTGLGMAVVWGTVKDHRGYIDIKSTEGKGTTFTLYFPVTKKEVAKAISLLSIDGYMSKGESILVIDDLEEQREIASRILKKLGYSVTSVSSGEKAVDYLKDNSADLLVLDMIMDPGIDGFETYKRILEIHPGQKAVIVSGFSETDRVKEAQRLGAGAYVKKPFLLEKIGLAIRDELGK